MSGNMGGDNDIEEEKDKGLFFLQETRLKECKTRMLVKSNERYKCFWQCGRAGKVGMGFGKVGI